MTTDQPPDRALVRDRVRRLDSEGFADFVAAVWSARGWTVERENALVVARDGERTQRILPVAVDWLGRPVPVADRRVDVDTVVTADDAIAPPDDLAGEPTVVDATALVDTFLYGIDSSAADRIAVSCFGTSVAGIEAPLWRRLGRRITRVRVSRRAALVSLVLLALVVGGVALQAGLSALGADRSPNGVSTPTPSATTATPMPGESTPESVDSPPDSIEVPGVGTDGSVTADRLIEAHSQRLTGRSYQIRRSYRGPPADGETDQTFLRSRTLATTPLRSLIEVRTTWTNGSQRGTEDLYYDGQFWYRAQYRAGSISHGNSSGAPDLLVVNTDGTQTLERYLQTSGRLVVTERRPTADGVRYLIEGRGAPRTTAFAGAANYTVTALVAPDGVVQQLSATYTLAIDDRRVPVSLDWRLERDEELVIEPPIWYRQEFATTRTASRTAMASMERDDGTDDDGP